MNKKRLHPLFAGERLLSIIFGVCLLGFIALICVQTAKADIMVSVGAGKSILDVVQRHPFERVITVGYQFGDDFTMRPMAGYYMTNGYGSPSAWVSYMFGVKAHSTTGATITMGVGPSYLFSPDAKILTGHFQFTLEGCLGLSSLNFLGICYSHLSSAGLGGQPNLGRDFLNVQWRFQGI